MTDEELVATELADCEAKAQGLGEDALRAHVRAYCLRKLPVDIAAATLREEMMLTLATDGPWFGKNAPPRSWVNENHRLAFVAAQAGCTSYRLPSDWEIRIVARAHASPWGH